MEFGSGGVKIQSEGVEIPNVIVCPGRHEVKRVVENILKVCVGIDWIDCILKRVSFTVSVSWQNWKESVHPLCLLVESYAVDGDVHKFVTSINQPKEIK